MTNRKTEDVRKPLEEMDEELGMGEGTERGRKRRR